MEDNKIVELYWNRDESAIAETRDKYGNYCFSIARNILHNQEDSEESVNDTYLAAWNQIPPTRPEFFFAWLAKVCRNAICHRISWMQAKKRNAVTLPLEEELAECLPSSTTEEEVDARELGRFLSTFLEGLPREKRLYFMRRYWFGDSIADIADRFGVGESKVKVTLHRTREKLKRELEKEGYAR